MIYFTSDLHFCHNKEFVYKPRGFNSVQEMNKTLVENWNAIVEPTDLVYVLGDCMLMDTTLGLEYMKMLNGLLHIIIGNHDTDNRIALYKELPNVYKVSFAERICLEKQHFFLTHYPCLTNNEPDKPLSASVINLSGHTHSKHLFFEDRPYVYNVAVDAHNNTPVSIKRILFDLRTEYFKNKLTI